MYSIVPPHWIPVLSCTIMRTAHCVALFAIQLLGTDLSVVGALKPNSFLLIQPYQTHVLLSTHVACLCGIGFTSSTAVSLFRCGAAWVGWARGGIH